MEKLLLNNHTAEEREAYIQARMAKDTYSVKRKRYNTLTSGPALKGRMSIHSSKRSRAAAAWRKKVKREMRRDNANTN